MSQMRTRSGGGPRGMGPGGMMMGAPRALEGRPGRDAEAIRRLGPEIPLLIASVIFTAVSVTLNVIGPKILGNATNIIFGGIIGKALPAGSTQQQAVAYLRAHGQATQANVVSGATNVYPGHGIDFTMLGRTLGLAALVYIGAACFQWAQGYLMAGVAQRTVYRLRRDVEAKLERLPLKYFDQHPHGDIMSRLTNDIDNITTTLQQGMSQLLTSLLTIVGVLVLMLTIRPLLSLVALVTVPIAFLITLLIARRAQRLYRVQWNATGQLNGHVEEMHTGHTLVQMFGQRQAAQDEFETLNQRMYRSTGEPSSSRRDPAPMMQVISNFNYRQRSPSSEAIGWPPGQFGSGDVQASSSAPASSRCRSLRWRRRLDLFRSGLGLGGTCVELPGRG